MLMPMPMVVGVGVGVACPDDARPSLSFGVTSLYPNQKTAGGDYDIAIRGFASDYYRKHRHS